MWQGKILSLLGLESLLTRAMECGWEKSLLGLESLKTHAMGCGREKIDGYVIKMI
jgi:hypothetical protein